MNLCLLVCVCVCEFVKVCVCLTLTRVTVVSCCSCWFVMGSSLMDQVVVFSDDAATKVDPNPHTMRTTALHTHTHYEH